MKTKHGVLNRVHAENLIAMFTNHSVNTPALNKVRSTCTCTITVRPLHCPTGSALNCGYNTPQIDKHGASRLQETLSRCNVHKLLVLMREKK